MSLFDISKSDPMRSIPAPNTNDSVTNRLAHGTTQNQNSGEEIAPDGLKFRERQILVQQDGDNKAVFGFLDSTNSFGLKVAKAGYDVLTTGDANLIFNSEQNVFKIVDRIPLSLTYTHSGPGSEYHQASVAHGRGTVPAFLAFHTLDQGLISYWGLSPSTGYRPNPSILPGASGGLVVVINFAEVSVDTTNVYLVVQTGGAEPPGSYTFSAITYILEETAV